MAQTRLLFFSLWESPVGWIGVVGDDEALVEVHFHPESGEVWRRIEAVGATLRCGAGGLPEKAMGQLQEYFIGSRRDFDLPLDFQTLPPFCVKTLLVLRNVAFGKTVTYGELAQQAGNPRAARAVGRAMVHNPFPLIVPCHRVVGAGGRLTGYSGGEGIATKQWLLDFERRMTEESLG
jgi:methylated-DNA-[protein]-cysteine S-methyltransferase